jgi:hypothetical protein
VRALRKKYLTIEKKILDRDESGIKTFCREEEELQELQKRVSEEEVSKNKYIIAGKRKVWRFPLCA